MPLRAPEEPGAPADRDEGWRAEELNRNLQGPIEGFVTAVFTPGAAADEVGSLAADVEFEVLALGPPAEVSGGRMLVLEASVDGMRAGRGRGELEGLLRAMTARVFSGEPTGSKVKVVRVDASGERPVATVLLQLKGLREERSATLKLELELTADPEATRIDAVRVRAAHAVIGPPSGNLFEEIGPAALGRTRAWSEDLVRPLEAWCSRIERNLGISLIGHEGLAVGDANGDGRDDLYLCAPGGLPNRLFVADAAGRATERAAAAGLDVLDATRSALFLDVDNDGDQDLALNADPNLVLYENDGSGRFTERLRLDSPSTTSLAAADYDLDGDLDLFVCGYVLPDAAHATPLPYHDALNGRPNRLFRNDLDGSEWSYADVTTATGLERGNGRFTFAAAWEDHDDDGDPDLYVANDFGRNNLYRNDGGRFVDVAAEAGVEDMAAGMGVTWGDPDRDGDMDLYVSNMFSAAGGRVTYDRRFMPGAGEELLASYRRHARGNTLFENRGDGGFLDVSERSGTTRGLWAWGALFHDLDADGWEDLVVPSGFVTGEDPEDL